MAKKHIFILGGARSGKSRFAQELAGKLGNKVLFVATGEPRDEEMQARINEHKKARRIYRDLLGKANQIIAQRANDVYFMVASLPVKIKGD